MKRKSVRLRVGTYMRLKACRKEGESLSDTLMRLADEYGALRKKYPQYIS